MLFCLSVYFINAGGGGGHRVLVCCWVLGSVPGSGSCLVILKICDRRITLMVLAGHLQKLVPFKVKTEEVKMEDVSTG